MRTANLSATSRNLLLTVHVAATVGVLGADLALLLLGATGLSGANSLTVYPAAHLIAAWMIAPLAVVALATGLALGWLTQWGLFRYWWTTIKLALTATLTGAVLFVLLPRLEDMAGAVSATPPQVLTGAERLPLVIAPAVASTLLVLALLLAIFKLGWRLRSRGRTG